MGPRIPRGSGLRAPILVVNRPMLVVNRPMLVVNRPMLVVNRPMLVVNRAAQSFDGLRNYFIHTYGEFASVA